MVNCESCLEDKDIKYGFKNGKKQFCKDCAKGIPNTCDLSRKMCKEDECKKEPTYNYPNEKSTLYCSVHKKDGMIDKKHKKCEYKNNTDFKEGCLLLPSYGKIGEKVKYCKNHSVFFKDMILIRNDLCKYKKDDKGCSTRASFNIEGKKVGKFCQEHKEEGMIFVLKVDTCIFKDCETRAIFNYINETKGIYCDKHKLENMYNIKDDRCIKKNCVKIASFNLKKCDEYLYCDEHKLENMVNLRSKKCIFENCDKLPTCNKLGQTIKLYCAEHKEDDMINVKNPRCVEDGCEKEALCNYLGEKKRLYCCSHKLPDMVDLCKKICKNIQGDFTCDTKGNKKYDGYCVRCYIGLFPNEPRTRNYKTKELKVCEFIKEQFSNLTISFDKIVKDGCTKRRPDIYIDMGSHSIIIEVDENQHDTYENICENKRFMEIFTDLGNRPMVLIRFNPDEYYNDKNELVKSCWSFSKEGISIINRNKKDEWKKRLNKLKDSILFNIENEPKKEIEITYLYYDEN